MYQQYDHDLRPGRSDPAVAQRLAICITLTQDQMADGSDPLEATGSRQILV
jgi:hypothetical protein